MKQELLAAVLLRLVEEAETSRAAHEVLSVALEKQIGQGTFAIDEAMSERRFINQAHYMNLRKAIAEI